MPELPDSLDPDQVYRTSLLWQDPSSFFAGACTRINTRADLKTSQRKRDNLYNDMLRMTTHSEFELSGCQKQMLDWALNRMKPLIGNDDCDQEFLRNMQMLLERELIDT